MTKPIVFLNSHPIQYFAPLYQQLAREKDMELEVVYCSDETVKGATDKQFGVHVQWDIPLLQGYQFVFLKNNALKPSIYNGFWGLLNLGIIKYLFRKKKSIVIIHGWGYATHILTIIWAKIIGHTVCIRAETPLNQELQKGKPVTKAKHLYLKMVFLFVDKFLYIGEQNKLFYQYLGKKEKDLVSVPYCVDNKRFQQIAASTTKAEARERNNLPLDKKIFLFSGKYIDKKKPLDLLNAFHALNDNNTFLVMVGDGELRPAMEAFIQQYQLQNSVLLTGFINQSEIPYYYAAADYFVMCSGIGETWGLSVNEAMNFGLPIIISDTCGSAYDLVKQNKNGYIYKTGDVEDLTSTLKTILNKDDIAYNSMCKLSATLIESYSYEVVTQRLQALQD